MHTSTVTNKTGIEQDTADFFYQEDTRSKQLRMLDIIEEVYAPRLQWHTMLQQVVLDGKPVDMAVIEKDMLKTFKLETDFAKLTRFVESAAKEKPYSPVVEYLNSLENKEPNLDVLNTLCEKLGAKSSIEKTYVRRWLVGAIARPLDPGCKMDTALIIQGGQGLGKTTFFETLFGDYFATLGEAENEKEELKRMYKQWGIEYGEFDTVTTKKGISELKNFMSRRTDEVRPLYTNTPVTLQRHFVLCGSTNKDEFLFDESGNRRFWVVNVEKTIDTKWVQEHRDDIWAAALSLYKAGEQWWLTDSEQDLSNEANKTFEAESPLETVVKRWLNGQTTAEHGRPYIEGQDITTADLLLCAIGKPAGQWSRKDEMEVGRVMRHIGYDRKKVRVNGQPLWCWQPVKAQAGKTNVEHEF